MARVSDYLKDLIAQENHAATDTAPLLAAIESDMAVLEGLEVCADEMGTFTAAGKHSEAVLSPELKNKSALWIAKAEAVSQGKTDLSPHVNMGTPAFESIRISMEDDNEGGSKKNIFRRIWEAIKSLALRIWKFMKSFFVKDKAQKIAYAANDIEEHLSRVRHMKPSKDKVGLSGAPLRMFTAGGVAPKNAADMMRLLTRTEKAFDVLSNQYCTMVADTQKDLTHSLKEAFAADFKDENKNSDLYRALKVFDPAKLAQQLGGTREVQHPTNLPTGVSASDMKVLMAGGLMNNQGVYFGYLNEGYLRQLLNHKPLERIKALTASYVQMHANAGHSEKEVMLAVFDTGTVAHLSKAAKAIADVATKNADTVKRMEEYQQELDRVFEECLTKDEDTHSTDAGTLVSALATCMCKRMVHPLAELQKLALDGAHAALEICKEHLDVYA